MQVTRRDMFVLGATAIGSMAIAPEAEAAIVPGRVPVIVAADADGNILHARFAYGETRQAARPADVDIVSMSIEEIANYPAHNASTTKWMALYCLADWIKEQALVVPADGSRPVDPLLTSALEPYAHILARTMPITSRALAVAHRDPQSVSFTRKFLRRTNSLTSLKLDEAMRIALLFSANDLVECFNDLMGGTLVSRMNEKAAELGMHTTHYYTCTGLRLDTGDGRRDNITSGADQIKMMKSFSEIHPEFLPYVSQTEYTPQRQQLSDAIVRKDRVRVRQRYRARNDNGELVTRTRRVWETRNTPIDTMRPVAQYIDEQADDRVAALSQRVMVAPHASMEEQVNNTETPAEVGDVDDAGDAVEAIEQSVVEAVEQIPDDETDSGEPDRGIRDCVAAKSGKTTPAGRALNAKFERPRGSTVDTVYVFLSGAESGSQRVAWSQEARDSGYIRIAQLERDTLLAQRPAQVRTVSQTMPAGDLSLGQSNP